MGVGKSTLGKELLKYLPHFERFDIDDYRRAMNTTTPTAEMEAWRRLYADTGKCESFIFESSGMSQNTWLLLGGKAQVLTLFLRADEATRAERLDERTRNGYAPVRLHFVPRVAATDDYVLAKLRGRQRIEIDTSRLSADDVLTEALGFISRAAAGRR